MSCLIKADQSRTNFLAGRIPNQFVQRAKWSSGFVAPDGCEHHTARYRWYLGRWSVCEKCIGWSLPYRLGRTKLAGGPLPRTELFGVTDLWRPPDLSLWVMVNATLTKRVTSSVMAGEDWRRYTQWIAYSTIPIERAQSFLLYQQKMRTGGGHGCVFRGLPRNDLYIGNTWTFSGDRPLCVRDLFLGCP